MTTLSDKYIAGFLDADGSVLLRFMKTREGNFRAYLNIKFSQRENRAKVLQLIQERIGGFLHYEKKVNAWFLVVRGKEAPVALSRIAQYLVIKRHYANLLLSYHMKDFDKEGVEKLKAELKSERRRPSLPLPVHPSRKWIAGYFDGDGCLYASVRPRAVSAAVIAKISTSAYDYEGIDILHKAFGGRINTYSKSNTGVLQWQLSMVPSKAVQFLGYFGAYSVVKKDQIDYLLGCAESGHFRQGEEISAKLKQLKTQPHRLSEVGTEEVQATVGHAIA